MKKRLQLVAALFCTAPIGYAQQESIDPLKIVKEDNSSFVFTESQLGEDDDMTQNVIMMSSNNNVYSGNIGYLFSPMRFKFRAYNSRYNDIYFNGVKVNNAETGQFSYSTIGGMNDATRGTEHALPFESNKFGISNIGGASNYNFRASNFAAGSKFTLSGCNRNYQLRGMLTHSTGLMKNGWAFMGTVGYRWGDEGFSEGTFYNSLAYFLSAEKMINDKHRLSFSIWGNPTERSTQGASTDEAYWLANDYYYNPYWGYQNGKKRNSRVVNNYEPSLLVTWDFGINEKTTLTTTLYGKYAMYGSTKLNYNNAENPAPDYWKNFPSYNYNVWDPSDASNRTEENLAAWTASRDYWRASKANRQINWDKLYFANQQMNAQDGDAAYYVQAKHNDHLAVNLASTLKFDITKNSRLHTGVHVATNKGMHYQTMEDLLGANTYHNINNYAIGTYPSTAPEVQYDLNHPNKVIGEGDRFGYDYNLFVDKVGLWASYAHDKGIAHSYLAAKIGGTQMWREGNMRNGLAPKNSYGESDKAYFLDGGFKMGTTLNIGRGNAITAGFGMEARSPQANTAFVSPEINNDFVNNLDCENVITAELGYALNSTWLRANVTGYYTRVANQTEWQNYYFDDVNSFTYVSLSNVEKAYYGAEIGLQFKVTSNFNINLIGSWSEAKYMNDTDVSYMQSTTGVSTKDLCMTKGMRESGTPLTAASLGLSYRIKGWYLDLNGNYYDRIYLSYSPSYRYKSTLTTMGSVDNEGKFIVPEQAKGNGGFMLDASIGRQFRIGKNSLSVNLNMNNLLNNREMVSGGYEQSRSDYTVNNNTGAINQNRTYKFSKNPKKYYAQGFNFMLNLGYRF